jgi:hypothetical protein
MKQSPTRSSRIEKIINQVDSFWRPLHCLTVDNLSFCIFYIFIILPTGKILSFMSYMTVTLEALFTVCSFPFYINFLSPYILNFSLRNLYFFSYTIEMGRECSQNGGGYECFQTFNRLTYRKETIRDA